MVEQGDDKELAEALDRFSKKADQLLKTENSNTAKVVVNAGGIGVSIILIAFALMLGLNISLFSQITAHGRKIERLEDYLSAIYSQAPHLRPKEDDGKEEDKSSR